jgi:hypothetical protein
VSIAIQSMSHAVTAGAVFLEISLPFAIKPGPCV